jgi:hypothetical protein
MSHFATSSPLEKNKSRGFQPASPVLLGDAPPLPLTAATVVGRLAPGLMSVKRCTKGMERMVEPPSVAAAVETVEEWAV